MARYLTRPFSFRAYAPSIELPSDYRRELRHLLERYLDLQQVDAWEHQERQKEDAWYQYLVAFEAMPCDLERLWMMLDSAVPYSAEVRDAWAPWLPHLLELGVPKEAVQVARELAACCSETDAARRLGVSPRKVGDAREKLEAHFYELVRRRDLTRAVRQLLGLDPGDLIEDVRAGFEVEVRERERAVLGLESEWVDCSPGAAEGVVVKEVFSFRPFDPASESRGNYRFRLLRALRDYQRELEAEQCEALEHERVNLEVDQELGLTELQPRLWR